MGLVRFTPKGWTTVQAVLGEMDGPVRDRMHMTGTLQRLIQGGHAVVNAVPYSGPWGEVDSPEDLALYHTSPDNFSA